MIFSRSSRGANIAALVVFRNLDDAPVVRSLARRSLAAETIINPFRRGAARLLRPPHRSAAPPPLATRQGLARTPAPRAAARAAVPRRSNPAPRRRPAPKTWFA
eukprot:30982-Pelagococcus_subviridis.AAC.3